MQDQTREVIARAVRRDGAPVTDEFAAVVHALWTGFMLYRLSNPQAIDAAAFQHAMQWLLAGAASDESGGKR